MIYNLYLNSLANTPLTNYYSAVLSTNRGQRIYAVDWSFLPDNKQFEVSFKFLSRGLTLTANDIYNLTANFTQPNCISAGSDIRRNTNSILGVIKPRQVTSSTDVQLVANPKDNEPIFLLKRPVDNFLEIKILDNDGAQYNLGQDYIMIISFEEVN